MQTHSVALRTVSLANHVDCHVHRQLWHNYADLDFETESTKCSVLLVTLETHGCSQMAKRWPVSHKVIKPCGDHEYTHAHNIHNILMFSGYYLSEYAVPSYFQLGSYLSGGLDVRELRARGSCSTGTCSH